MAIELFSDIKEKLPRQDMRVIFDVGANIGQSARDYLKLAPRATIYSFEPIPETYELLVKRFGENERVRCFTVALSSTQGEARMILGKSSTANHVLSSGEQAEATVTVKLTTGTAFCQEHDVAHINLLKVDTEGHDLAVLEGFGEMLAQQAIDLIQVEAGMHCKNKKHVPFEALKSFLEGRQYYLFKIYDQVQEFQQKPQLRRSNPVFISQRAILRNWTQRPSRPTSDQAIG